VQLLLALGGLLGPGCNASYDPDGFTDEDWAVIRELANPVPLGAPGNDSDASARLGQQLFFDRHLTPPLPDGGTVSCDDCHAPRKYFSDGHPQANVSLGFSLTRRNSPALVDVALYPVFAWDGRGETLWAQCDIAYVSPATMQGTAQHLSDALAARYLAPYLEAFPQAGVPAGGLEVRQNVAFAWEAYLRRLKGGPSRFDRFAKGEADAGFTAADRRGLKLFLTRAGCIECHRGGNFSDGKFYSVGVGQTGPGVVAEDLGRYDGLKFLLRDYQVSWNPWWGGNQPDLSVFEAERGLFRTKSLRNVEVTAPYFHAGQAATLDEVVRFYNRGGDRAGPGPTSFMVPLGLGDDEVNDLVSFLRSLTGILPDPDAGLLCDSSVLPPGVPPGPGRCR
jgi:cytochrome c peroxidase